MSLTSQQIALRSQIELASGGKQTVVFTPKGQPCFMYVVKKFKIEDVRPNLPFTGVHPMFIVDGVEHDEIYVGVYEASRINGELVSQPNTIPFTGAGLPWWGVPPEQNTIATIYDTLDKMNSNSTLVFHNMNTLELGGLRMLVQGELTPSTSINGYSTFGEHTEGRKRADGLAPTVNSGSALLTGTSGASHRFNHDYAGIEELAVNYWHKPFDVRLMPHKNGGRELQFYGVANNRVKRKLDSYLLHSGKSIEGWYAIDAETGAPVAVTSEPQSPGGTTNDFTNGGIATTQGTVRITNPGEEGRGVVAVPVSTSINPANLLKSTPNSFVENIGGGAAKSLFIQLGLDINPYYTDPLPYNNFYALNMLPGTPMWQGTALSWLNLGYSIQWDESNPCHNRICTLYK